MSYRTTGEDNGPAVKDLSISGSLNLGLWIFMRAKSPSLPGTPVQSRMSAPCSARGKGHPMARAMGRLKHSQMLGIPCLESAHQKFKLRKHP